MAEQRKLSGLTWVAVVLAILGALNWGLVGLFGLDVIATIFGHLSAFSRFVYILFALAGLYLLVDFAWLRAEKRRRAVTVT
jgi:uncharacterized membrane protein YuzA (DUF378 family)